MIAIVDREIIVLTPPKTGSTSLHVSLCRRENAVWIESNEPDGVQHHTKIVPPRFSGFKRVVLARDPYERFLSLWGHHQRHCLQHGEEVGTFDEHIDRVIDGSDWFHRNIVSLYGYNFSGYWQIERIKDCLRKHSLDENVHHLNRNTFAKKMLTEQQRKRLAPWAEPDAQAFGY